jgi:Ca2+-binding RTX toxin-like protein
MFTKLNAMLSALRQTPETSPLRRKFAPAVEALQERLVPATLPTGPLPVLTPVPVVTLMNGDIYIYRTNSADTATVGLQNKKGILSYKVTLNGQNTIFPVSSATAGGDIFFYGYDGNDTFKNMTALRCTAYGMKGNDTLIGGMNDDLLDGGDGNDTLEDNYGADQLFGGANNDLLHGGTYYDSDNSGNYLDGGDGSDTVYGSSGSDTIDGGAGNDRLLGLAGNDFIYGRAGDDHIEGNAGNDFLQGNEGDDRIFGGDDNDLILGGDDNDWLYGGRGSDELRGNAGTDRLDGGFNGHDDGAFDWLVGGADGDRFFSYGDDYAEDYSFLWDLLHEHDVVTGVSEPA